MVIRVYKFYFSNTEIMFAIRDIKIPKKLINKSKVLIEFIFIKNETK